MQVAKKQSCISLAAPPPPPGTCPRAICRAFSCQSSPGRFPTEPWEISSVLLGKQVVAVSSRGLSAMASLGLPRRGCVGGLSLVISISKGTAAAPWSPLGPARMTALRWEFVRGPDQGLEQEDGGRSPLGSAPPKLWLMGLKHLQVRVLSLTRPAVGGLSAVE